MLRVKANATGLRAQSKAVDALTHKMSDAKDVETAKNQRAIEEQGIASELTTQRSNLQAFTAANQEYSEAMLGLQVCVRNKQPRIRDSQRTASGRVPDGPGNVAAAWAVDAEASNRDGRAAAA